MSGTVARNRARIAVLVSELDVGGIQSMVDALLRGLDPDRFEPHAVCFDAVGGRGEALRRDGIDVVLVQRAPGTDFGLARRLAACFHERRIELVHAHNRTALFYGVLARGLPFWPRRLHPPPALLYTEHDRSFPESLKVRALQAILARRVDAVAAVCAHVRDAIVATEGFSPQRTRVILNGVAEPPQRPDRAAARDAIEREFPEAAGRVVALAVGHLTPVKDHAVLLEALGRIDPRLRPLVLVAGDGPLRPMLEARRLALGLERDVFLPGYRQDVDALLKACDLLVMPSRSEGLSIALVEGLARAVPIVATAVGGNPEIVEHEHNGLLVGRGDAAGLAAALERLVRDAAQREAFGTEGRRRYEERFRLRTMVDAYAALYDDVLARTRR